MFFVITWLVLAILVGVVASKYGKSGLLWTIISILVSPLIAGIILIFVFLSGESNTLENTYSIPELIKQCPFCADTIRLEAIKCKHCGADINDIKSTNEHIFTLSCYNCDNENEIRRATIRNFPNCSQCGKLMFDPKRKKQVNIIMDYVESNKDNIDEIVYKKITYTLENI